MRRCARNFRIKVLLDTVKSDAIKNAFRFKIERKAFLLHSMEGEGFEPSRRQNRPTGLANPPLQPLGYPSRQRVNVEANEIITSLGTQRNFFSRSSWRSETPAECYPTTNQITLSILYRLWAIILLRGLAPLSYVASPVPIAFLCRPILSFPPHWHLAFPVGNIFQPIPDREDMPLHK